MSDQTGELFSVAGLGGQPARRRRAKQPLTPAAAAGLYRAGQSACQIAAAHDLSRSGAETKILAGGLAGLAWCPICAQLEELHR